MKKIYITLVLAALYFGASAQKKFSYGLSGSVGNYGLPTQYESVDEYTKQTVTNSAGLTTKLGGFMRYHFTNNIYFGTEVLWSRSSTSIVINTTNSGVVPVDFEPYTEKYKVNEMGINMPFVLGGYFGKSKQFSAELGIVRTISMERLYKPDSSSSLYNSYICDCIYSPQNFNKYSYNSFVQDQAPYLFTARFGYGINEYLNLGLEFNSDFKDRDVSGPVHYKYPGEFPFYASSQQISMRSMSLKLNYRL